MTDGIEITVGQRVLLQEIPSSTVSVGEFMNIYPDKHKRIVHGDLEKILAEC